MMKHAFLIMAHGNWLLLSRLIKKLDHSNIGIYIHIDKKTKFEDKDRNLLLESCKESQVYFIERKKIYWGDYSMIDCELRLLKAASKEKYDYYHFLSGVDFPIQPLACIFEFFEKNKGFEFVHMSSDDFIAQLQSRYEQYHIFQKYVERSRNGIWFQIERISLFFQRRILKIQRSKKVPNIVYKAGSQWCSLTHSCVQYIISKEKMIRKMFYKTICCDELFVQTVLYNSEWKKRIYYGNQSDNEETQCLRAIDWKRGNPYTYTIEDYDSLIHSGNLFCRKVCNEGEKTKALVEALELL